MSDQNQTSKEQILKNAAKLLNFTTQICNEKGKQNLVTIFKDDIIRLTCEEKKLCSLMRLYNTFHELEPKVLQQLNDFLPPELRYEIVNDEHGNPISIQLPTVLKEHISVCPDLHMAPEEDQYDVFLTALNQIVDPQTADQFKILLSRFVKGQPETRIEVLQFIIKSAELLGDFPELLAGLLEYLNKTWYTYAVETMKFASVQQISLAYGVFNEQCQSLELFRRIIEIIKNNQLNETQQKWRQHLIKSIKDKVKELLQMCSNIMDQLKKPQTNNYGLNQNQQFLINNQQFEPKQIIGRGKKAPNFQVNYQQKTIQQFQQFQSNVKQSNESKNSLNDIKYVLDIGENELVDTYETMLARLAEYFNSNAQFKQILDVKVPVNYNFIVDIYKRFSQFEKQEKYQKLFNNTDKNNIDEKLQQEYQQQLKELNQFILIIEALHQSSNSMIWQEAALQWLSAHSKTTLQYIELDDCLELQKCFTYFSKIRLFLNEVDNGIPFHQIHNLLIQTYNNKILSNYEELIMQQVISQRTLIENILFFNQHADDAYGSEYYRPISYLDENRVINDYVIIDQQSGNSVKPVSKQHFTQFEQKLHDISMFQKHKYYRKNSGIVESKEPKDPSDQSCNYKFSHPLRTKQIDRNCVLNKNYYSAFQNGHENTSTLGLNPYNIGVFDPDVEKVFSEIEDCNQLEEQLMRYDIFIQNLKQSQLILQQYCNNTEYQLQLPSNCQILLKQVISEEYYQQLQVYPDIAAQYVLKRVNQSLTEIMKWRELIVGPLFSKRVNQLYYHSLDVQSKNLVEIDRKLIQGKQFSQELQQRKAVASILERNELKQLDDMKSKQMPWELETWGMSKLFLEQQAGYNQDLSYYQQIINKSLVPGCSSLYHITDSSNQLKIEYLDNEQKALAESTASYFHQKSQLFQKALQQMSTSRNSNKQHYCCDVHNIIQATNQIQPEHLAFIEEYVCQNNEEKQKFFKFFTRFFDQKLNGYESIIIIDQQIYTFLRLLTVALERVAFLKQVAEQNELKQSNFQNNIFDQKKINVNQQLETSYQQFLLKKQIYQEIEEIYQTVDENICQRGATTWDTLKNILLNHRNQYADLDLIAVFTAEAYLGVNYKQLLKQVKKQFDDLYDGYSKYSQISGLFHQQGILQKDMITTCQQQNVFSGYIIKMQHDDDLHLIAKVKNNKLILMHEIEVLLKLATQTINLQIIVAERVEAFLCYSEIDV